MKAKALLLLCVLGLVTAVVKADDVDNNSTSSSNSTLTDGYISGNNIIVISPYEVATYVLMAVVLCVLLCGMRLCYKYIRRGPTLSEDTMQAVDMKLQPSYKVQAAVPVTPVV
jgi:hypothetical protein